MSTRGSILVTGGAGYIGSHTVRARCGLDEIIRTAYEWHRSESR
jgi:nucleoside-diphosphate-sugar epimerase